MKRSEIKRFSKTWRVGSGWGDLKLRAEIPPYVWMYPGNTVAVDVYIHPSKSIGASIRRETHKLPEDCTRGDILDAIKGMEEHLQPCAQCGAARWSDPSSNRGKYCDACFLRRLDAEIEADIEKERREEARLDIRYRLKGYTHKVVAWIHPEAGGDDYRMNLYFDHKPTKLEVRRELSNLKSRVLNDYQIYRIGDKA